jgi:AcrR family transcriptional regulator
MHYDERYQQILNAGARVFARKGFHHASMRDMSRETGMSLAGLYYYFRSKEELLFLIQKDIFETILATVSERLAATQDPEEQLHALFEVHAGYCIREMDRVKVLSHESDSLEGEFWDQIRDLKRKYYRLVRSVLGTLRRRGRLIQPDPHVATMAYFGMVNWIYTWYRPGGPLDEAAIARELADIFCKGVLKG